MNTNSASLPEDHPLADAGGQPEFPPGIEGQRGEKDAAFRAREWYVTQRGLSDPIAPAAESTDVQNAAMNEPERNQLMTQAIQENTPATMTEATSAPGAQSDLAVKAGSLGETLDDAVGGLLLEMPQPDALPEDVARVPLGVSGGLSIDIAGIGTSSQAGSQVVFLRNTDALTFVMSLVASQQLVDSGRKFDANFQIIDVLTNTVKRNDWWNNSAFSWGTHFWISKGNNWGPNPSDYDTPAKWGLNAGLYLYRATVEVQGIGAFSFAQEFPFRVR